jgi:hypothetical protein
MSHERFTTAKIRNFAELAQALAEIASQTSDADAAQRLMALVHQLMTDAGVPPGSDLPASRNF